MRPFIGSEALTSGAFTRHQLRSRFVKLHSDVYVSPDVDVTAPERAYAAWLWVETTRHRGRAVRVGTAPRKMGRPRAPAQLLQEHRRPPPGIITWLDRISSDERQVIAGVAVTTPARTAFDLACRYPLNRAVAAIDALARATKFTTAETQALVHRYGGHHNIRNAREALALVDPGAQSPEETWLRLLVTEAGYPRPQTQLPIHGSYSELVGIVDMGWAELKLALEYDGEHQRTPRQFDHDIARYETMTNDLDWIAIRVTSQDTPGGVLGRLATAWARRTCHSGGKAA